MGYKLVARNADTRVSMIERPAQDQRSVPADGPGLWPPVASPVRRESRRQFLRRAGGLAGVWTITGLAGGANARPASAPSTLPALASRPNTGPIDEALKSTVVKVHRPEVVDAKAVHEPLMREMVEDALCVLTDTLKPADAWNKLLKPDDVIGIKFNQVGFAALGTGGPLATQLVRSLGDAGFPPERIVLIEVPDTLVSELKTKPRVQGFSGGEVSFGSGTDELAAVLQEITAIINVPFLKTHNIAGMTGCLKNLSHALVRRPARYHANQCTPFVGDIVALPQIRSKLRLHILNAVRAVLDGGPAVMPQNTWDCASLILSTDPVAVDAVGTDLLNDQRVRVKLPPVGNRQGQIAHVRHAAQIGLGTDDQDYIRLLDVPLL